MKKERAPPPPPPPPGSDPAVRVVNVSSSGGYALGFAARPSAAAADRTEFALCYEATPTAALACAAAAAAAAAASGGAEAEMAKRNAWILDTLPPLPDPGDDRFNGSCCRR